MNPTPREVLSLLLPVAGPLRSSLRKGIAYADEQQPNVDDRNAWFWAHCARFQTGKSLAAAHPQPMVEGWEVIQGVPNFGIHLRRDLHVARLVRSLGGTTPPAGPNKRRKEAWISVGQCVPQRLPLVSQTNGPPLVPLSLILDWTTDEAREPVVHVGLPVVDWSFHSRENPNLHWRLPLPEAEEDLAALVFGDGADDGDSLVTLDLAPEELGADDR